MGFLLVESHCSGLETGKEEQWKRKEMRFEIFG